MKTEQDYIRDITEIRSMMQRSTKFLTFTGWPGILAGIYALVGAYIAYSIVDYNLSEAHYSRLQNPELSGDVLNLLLLACIILALAIGTAILIPYIKSRQKGERLWNSVSRRFFLNMVIPLTTGGIFILIIFFKGILILIPPLTLIFYGLALLNASKFTYDEVGYLGIFEIALGLLATYFIGFGLIIWAIGFGIVHIIYGIYMHLRYEK